MPGMRLVGPCPVGLGRCSDTSGLVADPDERPGEEEAAVQGAVRLGQRADREVILARPGIDAEDLPGEEHHDEDQPGRHPAERRSAASTALPRPWLTHRFEMPSESIALRPAPEGSIDKEYRSQSD